MRVNDPQYNEWLKQYAIKKGLYNHKRKMKKRKKAYFPMEGDIATPKEDVNKDVILPTYPDGYVRITRYDDRSVSSIDAKAPHNFSIARNTKATVHFFNEIMHNIKKARRKADVKVYFNLEDVNELTIDSVMYLLAVLYNMKTAPKVKYHTIGNYPRDKKIKRYFVDSGFERFVRTTHAMDMNHENDNLEICSGNTIDENTAKKVCDFAIKCLWIGIKDTRFLYNMIVEMMANTYQHAYDKKSALVNHWYTFVECVDTKVKFIFLDTGSGIPATVARRLLENFTPPIFDSDSKYIISALNGEQRTSTKLSNRGRGLKFIRDCYEKGKIQKLTVISGKGYCNLDEYPLDISEEFNGTLYYWEIDRESIRKES